MDLQTPSLWGMVNALVRNGVYVAENAGAPVNGAVGTGTGAGICGPGSLLIDRTNDNLYINTGTLASVVWSLINNAVSQRAARTALSTAAPAIALSTGRYVFTRTSASAATLAAPPASPGGDGIEIDITSDTAFAHTITFTGSTLDSGSAAALTATFNAFKGSSITLESYNGRWKALDANGVSFS